MAMHFCKVGGVGIDNVALYDDGNDVDDVDNFVAHNWIFIGSVVSRHFIINTASVSILRARVSSLRHGRTFPPE